MSNFHYSDANAELISHWERARQRLRTSQWPYFYAEAMVTSNAREFEPLAEVSRADDQSDTYGA